MLAPVPDQSETGAVPYTSQAPPFPAHQQPQPAPALQPSELPRDPHSDPALGHTTVPALGASQATLQVPDPAAEEGHPVRARGPPSYPKEFVTE